MPQAITEKCCPIVLRGAGDARQVLVFRHPHPLPGVQLVKGTREPGESIEDGALRELAEESGISGISTSAPFGTSSAIAEQQLWHFVVVSTADLPDTWFFDTKDDGGHRFAFFWWPLFAGPDDEWHPDSARALAHVISALQE